MNFIKNLLTATVVLVGLLGMGVMANGLLNVYNNKPTVKTIPIVPTPNVENKSTPKTNLEKTIHNLKIPLDQIITLNDEVGDNSYGIATQIIEKSKPNKKLYLLINSPGGSVLDGALIISAMEAAPGPVVTVCMQLCASMAAIIHQYGTQRLMLDRSILMFHDAAGGMQGYFPHMRSQFDTVDKYVNRFDYYVADRVGLDYEEWMNTVHRNKWIDAEDAVDQLFADGLVFIQVIQDKKTVDLKSLIAPRIFKKEVTLPSPKTLFDVSL